jgi:hypothetical protein
MQNGFTDGMQAVKPITKAVAAIMFFVFITMFVPTLHGEISVQNGSGFLDNCNTLRVNFQL